MEFPSSPKNTRSKTSDQEFIAAWQKCGGRLDQVAAEVGVDIRRVMTRRRAIEKRHGIQLIAGKKALDMVIKANRAVVELKVTDGVVIVGSDAHAWPGPLTTAQRAFHKFACDKKILGSLAAIILNGDVFDGARVSRHPSIGWEKTPTVKDELDAVGEFLAPLEKVPGARKIWTLGNHDLRLESRIANTMPELAGVKGAHLKDFFPAWTPCWRVDINDDLVVKHRLANGLHAVYNNTLKSGRSMATGHLHSLKVTPWTDYNGTRYGIDTGTLADIDGEQFLNYTEAGPTNWRSGFVVLTFKGGRLLWPEIVAKVDDRHVEFRGELIRV